MIDLVDILQRVTHESRIQHGTGYIFDAGSGADWRAGIEDTDLAIMR
jgi:hypothetical protein